MTGISAKVIADSISYDRVRLTTLEVCLHRYILAELNTHRVFSRNFRSSRAVPVKKLLEEVRTNPAMPVHWGSNKPGMQAGDELTGVSLSRVQHDWRAAAASAVETAKLMIDEGLHKQVANRVLEPYLYVHGVVTATEWGNYFKLRCHPDAQPEIRVLAEAMRDAMADSKPVELELGEWHLPYTHETHNLDWNDPITTANAASVSAARCARVSYKLFDGTSPGIEKDLQLAAQLQASGHWSPFEHQATPDNLDTTPMGVREWGHSEQCRNFWGWRQHRAMIGG